jgi:DNA-binding NtrC family response regulator
LVADFVASPVYNQRIISASNKGLRQEVETGRSREDLFPTS